MPAGRPTKLTPEIQARIVDAIENGNYRRVAAETAGVCLRTFAAWLRKGKTQKQGPYAEFYIQVMRAECDAEIKMVAAVRNAAASDPRHAEWWLERKYPERWGSQRREINELRKRVEELESARADGAQSNPPPLASP